MDLFTWLFRDMHFALATVQSFKDFFPSVSIHMNWIVTLLLVTNCPRSLKIFGFDKLTTHLVQAPPYAIAYVAACVLTYSSGSF